ncbi:hypothetical protein [Flavobacterium beibuense]|uniref:Uncharacterized protein n=1 Tax=Flavobacterium beibuense TaxID=657326 RepID=A0A444WF16_9FLAO|nr:hypothetical protein [Flavobacterium beibuense]RYJ44366.1 hypothetical protein NU09_0976 [Flavobacterium beibuense]
MNDLLSEEEFLQPKPYNPWKRLIMFYSIAAIQTFLLGLTIFLADDSGICILQSVIYGACVLFIPFVLVFGNKKFILSKNSIIALGLLILNFVYSLLFFIPAIIGSVLNANFPDREALAFALVIITSYIFTTPFIFIMKYFSLKRIKKENKTAVEKHIRDFS